MVAPQRTLLLGFILCLDVMQHALTLSKDCPYLVFTHEYKRLRTWLGILSAINQDRGSLP